MLPNPREIRTRRKNLGITQSELSELTGISRTSILKFESGKSDLSYSKVKTLFDILEHIENQRMGEKTLTGITLEKIQVSPIFQVEASEKIHSVWAKMIEHNFSQVVVKRKTRVVGSITERFINRAISEKGLECTNSLNVETIMEEPFPILRVETPISAAIPILQYSQAVLTTKDGKVVGIVTNSDIGNVFKLSNEC